MCVNRSGEVESLADILTMIGGTNDYMAAIMIAAYINVYKESVSVETSHFLDTIMVHVYNKKYPPKLLIDVTLPDKYADLFA